MLLQQVPVDTSFTVCTRYIKPKVCVTRFFLLLPAKSINRLFSGDFISPNKRNVRLTIHSFVSEMVKQSVKMGA
jgi:hypothetical protein